MALGAVKQMSPGRIVWILALLGVIFLSAYLLATQKDLSTNWSVVLSVVSAAAGAALGNALQHDQAALLVRNQARPAIRHLFDQLRRVQLMVLRVEDHGAEIEAVSGAGRVSDWFAFVGRELRQELEATATAIEHWSDLAPGVRKEEHDKYAERTIPDGETGGAA